MLVSGIKSRPVYGVLKPDPNAGQHLIAAEGEGALAVLAMAADARAVFLAHAMIFYTSGGAKTVDHSHRLRSLGVQDCRVFDGIPPLLARFDESLATATMNTRLYVSGTEGFIGQIIRAALEHGIDHAAILTEHRGSLARRVQCVHCKGTTENVASNLVTCAHCGVRLLVRDHYSRRFAAFMGVAADAEVPGDLPPLRELYP